MTTLGIGSPKHKRPGHEGGGLRTRLGFSGWGFVLQKINRWPDSAKTASNLETRIFVNETAMACHGLILSEAMPYASLRQILLRYFQHFPDPTWTKNSKRTNMEKAQHKASCQNQMQS